MTEKILQTRIKNKYATKDQWDNMPVKTLKPLMGEICVINDIENNTFYLKVGDNINFFEDLPCISLPYENLPKQLKNDIIQLKEKMLPEVSIEDNGKFLRVIDGAWATALIPKAEEATFGG